MRKRIKIIILVLSILVLSINNIIGQDIIYMKDGSLINVEIEDFRNNKIVFKLLESSNAKSHSINIRKVKYIESKNESIKKMTWYINLTESKKGSFTDKRDSITYKTVTIEGRTWMAENLKATQMADGKSMVLVDSNTIWNNLVGSNIAYCFYDNKQNIGRINGILYTWEAANLACPAGWRLPTNNEWTTLITNIKKLDSIDLTILPSGFCRSDGLFFDIEKSAYFWFVTEYNGNNAYSIKLNSNLSYEIDYYYKSYGFSVRCIKD